MEQEMEKQEQELRQQLNEAIAADEFFESAAGKLIVKLITHRVTISTRTITSDKFKNDHAGYVNELAWLNANKQLLRELQVAASPQRKAKIREKLEPYEQ